LRNFSLICLLTNLNHQQRRTNNSGTYWVYGVVNGACDSIS